MEFKLTKPTVTINSSDATTVRLKELLPRLGENGCLVLRGPTGRRALFAQELRGIIAGLERASQQIDPELGETVDPEVVAGPARRIDLDLARIAPVSRRAIIVHDDFIEVAFDPGAIGAATFSRGDVRDQHARAGELRTQVMPAPATRSSADPSGAGGGNRSAGDRDPVRADSSPGASPGRSGVLDWLNARLLGFIERHIVTMPRPVQVVAYLTLLYLFVYLVLLQSLGITYFHGRVKAFPARAAAFSSVSEVTSSGKLPVQPAPEAPGSTTSIPSPQPASGITVRRVGGPATRTNDDGEFIIPVQMLYVPAIKRSFEFGVRGNLEEVTLSTPLPLHWLLGSEPTSVFFVPDSRATRGGIPARFFLNRDEALRAYKGEGFEIAASPHHPGRAWRIGRASGARQGDVGGSGLVRIASAEGLTWPVRFLKITDFRVSELAEATSLKVEVTVDGETPRQPAAGLGTVPMPKSLDVFPSEWVRPPDFLIPVPPGAQRVRITLAKRGFLRNSDVGEVEIAVAEHQAGKAFVVPGPTFQVRAVLFPPARLRSVAVESAATKSWAAVVWLDSSAMTPDESALVQGAAYELGEGFADRRATPPKIDKKDSFALVTRITAPRRVRLDVTIEGAGELSLSHLIELKATEQLEGTDRYYSALAAHVAGKSTVALDTLDALLGQQRGFLPAQRLRIIVLSDTAPPESVLAAYDDALAASDDSDLLNEAAWYVADSLPSPTPDQLTRALHRAQAATQQDRSATNLDTLGWVLFRLGRHGEVRATLEEARRQEELSFGRSSSTWQAIRYHQGRLEQAAGNSGTARRAFEDVLAFGRRHPLVSDGAMVADAQKVVSP